MTPESPRYVVRKQRVDIQQLQHGMQRVPQVLARLGFKDLRPGQDKVISCIMAGQDTVGILPTSTGKTACFVVPTLALGWRTIVFSPLISLIRDQQQSLAAKGVRVGAMTSHVSDSLNMEYMRQWMRGELDMLYIAPERLRKEEFLEAMRKMPPDLVAVDECFTPDVEILTEHGFVRFDALPATSRVAEFDAKDRSISFVKPLAHICQDHVGTMTRLLSDLKCDVTMTDGHEMLLERPSGFHKQAVSKISLSHCNKIPTAGFAVGAGESDELDELSAAERLVIAYQADGSAHNARVDGSVGMSFSFVRPRKITRFLRLMSDGGFKFSEVKAGRKRRFLVPGTTLAHKTLSEYFKLSTMSWRKARNMLEEIAEWDGSRIGKNMLYYSSAVADNADFVQALAVLAGYHAYVTFQDDKRKASYKRMHRVFISKHRNGFTTQVIKRSSVDYNGKVYCVMVPSGNIVVRRNGKVMITGNCHCLSGWSDTFRSAYCIIGDFITELNPKVVAAFTATCPPQVERDVRRVLCIENAVKAIHYPRRTNLDLRSSPWVDTVSMLTMLNRAEASSSDGTSIIYCATKKRVEETASALESLLGRPTVFYHGGMTKSARSFVQDQFMQGDARVLVATNAFGMGVDKATVRLVMHRDIAGSMEAQFQEDGRGGRDGKYTLCHTFFDSSSVRTHRFLIGLSCPTFAEVQLIYKALRTHASSSGVINMTHEEIAKKAGLEAPRMSAILQVLAGSQVIERSKATEKLYALKVLNQVEDRRLTEIMDVVRSFGIPGDDGYWDIPLHTLVDEIGCSDNTMRTRLNAFAKAGVMGVVAPERTSPVKLIGDIRQVDGERVDMLRQIAETKLAGSIQYADKVPDAEKHAYMEAHMGINAT